MNDNRKKRWVLVLAAGVIITGLILLCAYRGLSPRTMRQLEP